MTDSHASVLLTRTPTSAGMKNLLPGTLHGRVEKQDNGWAMVEQDFGVSKEAVAILCERFEHDMEKIIIDVFSGQCTPGHLSKESTKRVWDSYWISKVSVAKLRGRKSLIRRGRLLLMLAACQS